MEHEIELSPKEQLIIEASAKITKGQSLILEGKLELKHLLGLVDAKSSEKKKPKKTIANRTARLPASAARSTFRKETRSDEEICRKITRLIHLNRSASTPLIIQKLQLSRRHGERLIQQLVEEHKIYDKNENTERPAAWMLVSKNRREQRAPQKKDERFPSKRGSYLDYTDLMNKVFTVIQNDDWVTKKKIKKQVSLSDKPLNRILEVLKKEGKITLIRKKHNPAHKEPKNFERDADYWVAT